MKLPKTNKNKEQQTMNDIPVVELEGKGKLCKHCGKELIGKEKLFCRSCLMKNKDRGKKILAGVSTAAGALATIVVAIVANGESTPGGSQKE